MGSDTPAEIDIVPILVKRLIVTGSTLMPRTDGQKAEIAASLRAKVRPLPASGDIKLVIHATFPLAEAARAHAMMESGGHIGKILLIM